MSHRITIGPEPAHETEKCANIREWSVSELSAALKHTVEDVYGYVRVKGEVSGFRGQHQNGHVYFTLKDESAVLNAVIWRSAWSRMRVKPQEGLEVIASGKLTTFAPQSKYQLDILTLELAGIGSLMKLLEERKKKLEAEGLFDEVRKQPLPFLPEVIGVVTSPSGAVIRDILHRLNDRFPRRVLVWPVRVQGETSAIEVAQAINGFNALSDSGLLPRPGLIIVARGGGSLEDLWSFNEEVVVRAAANSTIPLISAVGHETDITLIDFAADRRAPTPTAAAELAVPVRSELMAQLAGLAARKFSCWRRNIVQRRKELVMLARTLPKDILAAARQLSDMLTERLPRALRANAQLHHMQYLRVAGHLAPRFLCLNVERGRERYENLNRRLQASLVANAKAQRISFSRDRDRMFSLSEGLRRGMKSLLRHHRYKIERAAQLLTAYSYREVLKRGFTLVRDDEGQTLQSAASLVSGSWLEIEFADGRVGAVAAGEHTSPRSAPNLRVKSRSRGTGGGENSGGQGSLFE
jgi:exodeoxyribonuclease VII large subunit